MGKFIARVRYEEDRNEEGKRLLDLWKFIAPVGRDKNRYEEDRNEEGKRLLDL